MHLARTLMVVFAASLAISISGCGETSMAGTGKNQSETKHEFSGEWQVAEWICDTGDGPFNFERNVGWKFNFSGSELKLIKHDGTETKFEIHAVPNSSPKQLCLVANIDFDNDGKPDVSMQRNCLVKLQDDKLILVYGGASTNISLDTGQGESIPGMPTDFEANSDGSLLTLEKTR